MLNRESILREMGNTCSLWEPEEYRIGCGAALVLHGVREETRDIDVEVHPRLFRLYSINFPVQVVDATGIRMISISENIDIHLDSLGEFETIDGLSVSTLPRIREWKLNRGRPKDLADVMLIDEFLRREELQVGS